MGVFKNYDGDLLGIPDHKHSVNDTLRNSEIAVATKYDDGFMTSDDRIRLTNLKIKMDNLNDKMQNAVYINDEIKS